MSIAWHPSRWWDLCVPEDEKKEAEKLQRQIKANNVLINVEIWSKKGYNRRLLWTKTNDRYIYDQYKQGGGL